MFGDSKLIDFKRNLGQKKFYYSSRFINSIKESYKSFLKDGLGKKTKWKSSSFKD